MRAATWMMLVSASLTLAACGEPEETNETADMPMAAESMPMNENMPMAGPTGQMANAEGTVTAIDAEAGTITIDHGPVPAVNWPAMTMGFAASEELRNSVAEGDEVSFIFRRTADGGEIEALTKK